MASPDDLDDLLSSFDASGDDGVADFEQRPRTERIQPDELIADSLPPIRTPLPPAQADLTPARSPGPTTVPLPKDESLPTPVSAFEPTPAPALEPALEPTPAPALEPTPAPVLEPTPAPALERVLESTPLPTPALTSAPGPASGFEEAFALAEAERDDGVMPTGGSRPLPTIFWVGIVSFAVAGLGAILYSQVDAFHPERQATRSGLASAEKERAEAAHAAAQPTAGQILVRSEEAGAAVWLLLGRTPLESIRLPSAQVHEVRFSLTGYKSVDAVIDRSHWNDAERVFRRKTELIRGESNVPAYPPEQSIKPPAGPEGRGRLVLSSDPPGARAWLLVGFTPEVSVAGIETGRRYELRIEKDGFLPSHVEVAEDDWSAGRRKAVRDVKLSPKAR